MMKCVSRLRFENILRHPSPSLHRVNATYCFIPAGSQGASKWGEVINDKKKGLLGTSSPGTWSINIVHAVQNNPMGTVHAYNILYCTA